MRFFRFLVVGLALTALGGRADAAFTVLYDFTGATGTQTSTAGTVTGAGLSPTTSITRGAGISTNIGANSINSNGWDTGANLNTSLNDYYTLTLTPSAGYTIALGTLAYTDQRSGTGPQSLSVRTSIDGFQTDVFSYTIPGSGTQFGNRSFNFASAPAPASFTNLSSAVEIRIYGWGAGGPLGTYRLTSPVPGQGFELTGSETLHTPAPPTVLAVLFALPTLLFARRRRAAA